MQREVVDALFGLFDERIAHQFPSEFFGAFTYFLERLIDRNRAYRYRTVTNDPFAEFVDVLSGRKIHDRVRSPISGPDHFVDFFRGRRRDGGIADVGIDFYFEI